MTQKVSKADRTLTPQSVTATSLPIAPLTDAQRTADFGVSGLNRFGTYIAEEFLPQLQGAQGMKLLREMRENDPTVGSILFILEQLIKQVDWTVTSHGENPDAQAQDDAEYIRQCLFDDMAKTWTDTLSEISSMFWAGYAPMEVIYKRRLGLTPGTVTDTTGVEAMQYPSQFDDGRWAWDKWAVRAQETVVRWEFDARNEWMTVVQQAPPDFLTREIPREKILLFRVKADRENPEGRSLLRSAFTSWAKKKKIETIEGIGIERKLAGFPVLTPPEGMDLWNTNDPNAVSQLANAKAIVKGIRMDEQMGMVKPFGWEFSLMSADGGRSTIDTNLVIERYDHRMAMTVAMDFLFLGSGGTGARAQAVADMELFTTALSGILDGICDVINRHAIPKLFYLNGQTRDGLPKLVHGDAGAPNLAALGSYITALSMAGMPLFPDPELEHSLRVAAGLPEPVGGVSGVKPVEPTVPKPTVPPVVKRKRPSLDHALHVPPPSDRGEFVEAVKELRKAVGKLIVNK